MQRRNGGGEADLGVGRKWVLGRGSSRDKSFAPRAWLGSLRRARSEGEEAEEERLVRPALPLHL